MKTQARLSLEKEQYCFYRLYSLDLDDAKHILRLLKRYRRKDVRHYLLMDLVVTYCRPFSGSRGDKISRHVLCLRIVPKDLRPLHNELLNLRNQLFAHTDLTYRRPRVVNWSTASHKWFPMSFRASDGKLDGRVSEIQQLVTAVEANLQSEIDRIHETRADLFAPDERGRVLSFTGYTG
jgi:hypothetical protein